MVYIRTKQAKGERYLYLVRSVWDSKRSTSRQETIKYLGKASNVKPEDIPPEYRDNPKIMAFLTGNTAHGTKADENASRVSRDDMYRMLVAGNADKAFGIYKAYCKASTLGGFYENILKPAMYDVGAGWARGTLSIADEHVASNAAARLIGMIDRNNSKTGSKAKILICVPNGEEHSLGCGILQSFLQYKGYRVFNLSPSAPADAVIHFIRESKPDLVLVSITINDNIRTGQRLIKKIQTTGVPVLAGGQAVGGGNTEFACSVVAEGSLEAILRAIRGIGRTMPTA